MGAHLISTVYKITKDDFYRTLYLQNDVDSANSINLCITGFQFNICIYLASSCEVYFIEWLLLNKDNLLEISKEDWFLSQASKDSYYNNFHHALKLIEEKILKIEE